MIQWKAHNGCVRALSYSPDGAILVSEGIDDSLRLWDPVSGARRADVPHVLPCIEDLAFSPDGRLLALAIMYPMLVVCDPASLRDGSLTVVVAEHAREAGIASVAFSPDGRNLVTVGAHPGMESQAILWDVAAFHYERQDLSRPVLSTTMPGRSSHRVSYRLPVARRDRRPGALDPCIEVMNFKYKDWVTATYAPDGRAVALGCSGGTIMLWPDPIPWEHLRRRDEPFDRVVYDQHVRRSRVAEVTVGSGRMVRQVAFSPDGTTLAAVVRDDVLLWDYQHPDEKPPIVSNRRLLRGHAGYVIRLAFAPDGRTIASVARDGTLRFWDSREAIERCCLDAGVGPLRGLAFAPDGMTVAVGSEQGDIVIIDVDERR
jgi:WD40 repeat protein